MKVGKTVRTVKAYLRLVWRTIAGRDYVVMEVNAKRLQKNKRPIKKSESLG
jgi:hypothetical protein